MGTSIYLRRIMTPRGLQSVAIVSRNGSEVAHYPVALNRTIPRLQIVYRDLRWQIPSPIPCGESTELEVERIEVTERSIALRAPTNTPEALARAAVAQILRRAFDPDPRIFAAATLAAGATVAQAHPGHADMAPHDVDAAASAWCIAALIAGACVALARRIAARKGDAA